MVAEPAASDARRRRVDAEVQAETPPERRFRSRDVDADHPHDDVDAEEPSWSRHDLGFALQQLRSIREGVVRRTLRKLHIRWFHAGTKRMQTLLQAAGVHRDVLTLIPSIVDTCSVCRSWQRVGPRSVTSARLPQAFNLEVQIDLLFYKAFVILHCIDVCTRWSAACVLSDRHTTSLLEGFSIIWLRLFGPPSNVLSDQEGGLTGDEAGRWFDAKGIQLHLHAREQHCGMIERHNEILRRQLHLIEDQTTAEGLPATFDMILSEALFAKNALFQCGGASPYEAVFGRTPPLLTTVSEESGEAPSDREVVRIRQIAIGSMIQATSDSKARIAYDSKTRRAGELLELKCGDLVDFYRKPVTKDHSGWHGPAEVVNLTSLSDGMLHVIGGKAVFWRFAFKIAEEL